MFDCFHQELVACEPNPQMIKTQHEQSWLCCENMHVEACHILNSMGHRIVGQGHVGHFCRRGDASAVDKTNFGSEAPSQSAHNCSHNKVGGCKMMQVTTIVCMLLLFFGIIFARNLHQCIVSFCDVMSLEEYLASLSQWHCIKVY